MKTIVINRMYAGTYINNKLGGEIINLLHTDSGDNYVFVNPYGYINKMYNDSVVAVVDTRLLKSGCFEILGISLVENGQIVHPKGYTRKEKGLSCGKQIDNYTKNHTIEYGGVPYKNIVDNVMDSYITFKSNSLLIPKEQIFITDSDNGNNVPISNFTFNLPDKRFPKQSLISYITDVDNPTAFKIITDMIKNDNLWDTNKVNKVQDNKIIDKHFNYLSVIKKEDDELVYSNLFAYFFCKYPQLLQKFSNTVLNIELDGDMVVNREKHNIDLLIEDNKDIIVIENKIKSGINGVSIRHDFSEDGLIQSQLSRYHEYIESKKERKDSHYFIFIPDYNKVDLSKYTGSKRYTVINYSKLYDFFSKQSVDDVYYKEFVNSLYKHTKDRENDYAEDMACRFLQKIKAVKRKQNS